MHGLQIILGKVRPYTSPRRGPSTGSDHCSLVTRQLSTAEIISVPPARHDELFKAIRPGPNQPHTAPTVIEPETKAMTEAGNTTGRP